jgi:hypothetical protein
MHNPHLRPLAIQDSAPSAIAQSGMPQRDRLHALIRNAQSGGQTLLPKAKLLEGPARHGGPNANQSEFSALRTLHEAGGFPLRRLQEDREDGSRAARAIFGTGVDSKPRIRTTTNTIRTCTPFISGLRRSVAETTASESCHCP